MKAAAIEPATPTQVASTAPVSLALAGAPAKTHRAETKDSIPVRVALAPVSTGPAVGSAASSNRKAAAVAGKRIVVQAGAFQSEANAHNLTKQLGAKGIASLTVVHDRDRDGRDWYIVRSSEFATREGAEAVAQSIRDAGQSAAMVMRITAPQGDGDVASSAHD
jgi:septal ring-binding cell division protein DamX